MKRSRLRRKRGIKRAIERSRLKRPEREAQSMEYKASLLVILVKRLL